MMWQVYDFKGNEVLAVDDLYVAQRLANAIGGRIELKGE